jgi:hypothetical protein
MQIQPLKKDSSFFKNKEIFPTYFTKSDMEMPLYSLLMNYLTHFFLKERN